MLENLATGFHHLLSSPSLLALIAGAVTAGIVFGALPGLTSTMGMALFLPFTFYMSPEQGLAVLVGIFAGGIYGGSVPAILLGVPGTPASAATIIDGFEMTKRGRAGEALGMAAIASGIGGAFSALVMMVLSPLVAQVATRFGAPEFFLLAVYALTIISAVSGASLLKGLAAGLLGLVLGLVGVDPMTAQQRLTFGSSQLYGGLNIIPVLIGLFGLSQVLRMAAEAGGGTLRATKVGRVLPRWSDVRLSLVSILRGGGIGTAIGALPGTGTDIGAFLSYSEAKRRQRHPIPFGEGSPEGVAAPEAGNNGVTGGALIPTLTLGIPGEAATAVLLGGLMLHGITPGPGLFEGEDSNVVYGLFASFFFADIVMLVLGLGASRLFAKVVSIPPYILGPLIAVLCVVGAYSVRNSMFDVWLAAIFGVLGYFMQRGAFPIAPVILGMIVGPLAESNLRRTLILNDSGLWVVFTRPISLVILAIIAITLVFAFRSSKRAHRAGDIAAAADSTVTAESDETGDTAEAADSDQDPDSTDAGATPPATTTGGPK